MDLARVVFPDWRGPRRVTTGYSVRSVWNSVAISRGIMGLGYFMQYGISSFDLHEKAGGALC